MDVRPALPSRDSLPGATQVWRLPELSHLGRFGPWGRAGSGFRMSERLHRTPEGQPQPHASTLRWQSEDKSHREGVPATKRSHPPLAPGLTSPPWLSPRPGVRTAGGQGGPTTRKAFLELSTPEATGLAKGRERKSPNKETRGNAEELFYYIYIKKITLGSECGFGWCHLVWFGFPKLDR